MKEFISGAAMLLLLSVFLVQFTANQGTHNKLLFAQNDVQTALQEVRQEGFFSSNIKDELSQRLIKDLKLESESAIAIVSSVTSPAPKGTMIDYSITITVEDVIGAASFLGISEEDNKAVKVYSGQVISEYDIGG